MGQPTDVMRRKMAAFNAQESQEILAIFSPDCQKEVPGASLRGSDQVVAYFQVFWEAFPDIHLTVEGSIEEGSLVAVQGRARGTHTGTLRTPSGDIAPTHRQMDLRFSDLYDVRDGRIVSTHLMFDQLALLQQLGVAPAPAHV
jgi:predicted ester cyclase